MKAIGKIIKLAFVIGAIYGLWCVWSAIDNTSPVSAAPRAPSASSRVSDAPDSVDETQLLVLFNDADRDYLRENYGPKAKLVRSATVRFVDHPDHGRIYVRQSIARNELGREMPIASALTLKDGRWTYYNPDAALALVPIIKSVL